MDVCVSRYVLGEGEHFAKTVRDGREQLGDVTDRVGVVVVGDADAPQVDVLGYVPDAALSGSGCFPSLISPPSQLYQTLYFGFKF